MCNIPATVLPRVKLFTCNHYTIPGLCLRMRHCPYRPWQKRQTMKQSTVARCDLNVENNT